MKWETLGRNRRGWIGMLTTMMLLHGLMESQAVARAGEDSPARSESKKSESIPFVLRDGYLIVVEGRIGPRQHLKLMIDTGSTHSVLRPDLAEHQERVQGRVRTVNLDQVLKQKLVEVDDFQLGPIRIPRLPILLHDLGYLGLTAPGIDGIIGLDVLRSRRFSIDFGRRRIAFGSSLPLQHSARMELDEACLTVDILMVNKPVRLVLDTGVQSILLYRDRLGDRLPELRVEQQIQGASMAGSASLDVVTLPRMQLSGTNLKRRAALLRNSPVRFMPQVDGYLSLTALGAQRFTFDFENSILSWE